MVYETTPKEMKGIIIVAPENLRHFDSLDDLKLVNPDISSLLKAVRGLEKGSFYVHPLCINTYHENMYNKADSNLQSVLRSFK